LSSKAGLQGIGFNPYFTGCSTSTTTTGFIPVKKGEFQSLFYWMFYFNSATDGKIQRGIFVSILILLDVLLQRFNDWQ